MGAVTVTAEAGQGFVELAVVLAVMPFGQTADEQFAKVTLVIFPTAVLPVTVPFTDELTHVMVETLLPSAFVAVRLALVPVFRLPSTVPE